MKICTFSKLALFSLFVFINSSTLLSQNNIRFLDLSFGEWELLTQAVGVIEAIESNSPNAVFNFLDEDSTMEYDSILKVTEQIQSFWEDGRFYPPYINTDYEGKQLFYERIYFKKPSKYSKIEYVAQFIIVVNPEKERENVIEIYLLLGADVLKRDAEIIAVDNGSYGNLKIQPTNINLVKTE